MKLRGHYMQGGCPRTPELTNAYLVGGGIASLAAAVHLIHDARVPASQIHILESGSHLGGFMSSTGTPEVGYTLRGGQMLNFSYECLRDLLSVIPSLANPAKTALQEIDEFNAVPGNKIHANARLVARGAGGPQIVDVKHLGLNARDRYDLVRLVMKPEKKLDTQRITDCFEKTFFRSKFWFLWSTMFAFQSWHSAAEFRRYLHKYFHEFPLINTLEGVDRTPYNQYDSIILPIEAYLKAQGVDFKYNTKVQRLSFADESDIKVEEIHFLEDGATSLIQLNGTDIIFITLGSITACTSIGSNISPPAPFSSVHDAVRPPDGAWELWSSFFWSPLLKNSQTPQLGNPRNFYSRAGESNLLWFTVTLNSPEFFKRFEKWSCNAPGCGGITTFKDSNWLVSIIVPHQPYFLNQPENVQVFWGYALFAERFGNVVGKPMIECTGKEILTEILGLLNFPEHPILENSITIPCMMPYMTSQFLKRSSGDRPQVIPKGSSNLAFLGQFVDIPQDAVCPVEYSVRSAQMAVFGMMGVDKKPKNIRKAELNFKALANALKTLLA